MNKVILIGRLGADPEHRFSQEGKAVCKLRLATDSYGKDNPPDWHSVVCFGKQAENTSKYCGKGSLISIEGRLQTRKYEGENGTQYFTEVIANSVGFLQTKQPGGNGSSDDGFKDDNADENIPL